MNQLTTGFRRRCLKVCDPLMDKDRNLFHLFKTQKLREGFYGLGFDQPIYTGKSNGIVPPPIPQRNLHLIRSESISLYGRNWSEIYTGKCLSWKDGLVHSQFHRFTEI